MIEKRSKRPSRRGLLVPPTIGAGLAQSILRTRQLIELGGLVELADDDRATLYGAFLTVAAKLRGEERELALALGKRKGKRAFDADCKP